MTREELSWQKQLQRNRNEMRRLDRYRLIASILFFFAGVSLVITILLWASLAAQDAISFGGPL